MKYKKLAYVLVPVFVFSALLAFRLTRAENGPGGNNGSNENHGNSEERGLKRAAEVRGVGSPLEVHILNDGKVLVRGAKVTGVSGHVISADVILGSVKMEWAVNTDSSKFIRKFGGISDISEIAVGDLISFHGQLVTTVASPLTVNADAVKDWSIQKKEANANGTVKSVDTSGGSSTLKFVLTTEDKGDVKVTATSTTIIRKGDGTGAFADIVVGAKLSARGVWNTLSNELAATGIKIQVRADKGDNEGDQDHEKTVVGGTLKSIAGTTAPTTLVLTSEGKDYTVNIDANTSVLGTGWLHVSLSTLVVGDKLQVYGQVNTDMSIDATVVRDVKH